MCEPRQVRKQPASITADLCAHPQSPRGLLCHLSIEIHPWAYGVGCRFWR